MTKKETRWITKTSNSMDFSTWDNEIQARTFAYGFSFSLPKDEKIFVKKVVYETVGEYAGRGRNES